MQANSGRSLWLDSAYRNITVLAALKHMGLRLEINHRAYKSVQ